LAGLDEIAFVDADLADALAELGGQVNLGGSMRPSPRPSVRSSDLASRPMTTIRRAQTTPGEVLFGWVFHGRSFSGDVCELSDDFAGGDIG